MKNFIFVLLLLASGSAALSSCKDGATIPAPAEEDLPLIFPTFVTGDTVNSYIKLRTAIQSVDSLAILQQARPVVKFLIAPTERNTKLHSVEVYKSYGRATNADFTSFGLNPRVKLGEYTTFPTTVTVNSDELLNGLTLEGVPLIPASTSKKYTNFSENSAILITFEYVLEDGRRIVLTPLSTRGAVTGTFTNAPYALRIFNAKNYATLVKLKLAPKKQP